MADNDPLVRRSKRLSLVLRHDPGSVGLKMDGAGWVAVKDLLPALRMSMPELEHVVADNNKKRFEFNEDKTLIRASQGHSVDVDLGYTPSKPPNMLFHGTSGDFLESILKEGLEKRARHHVHLSADYSSALVVARRRRRPCILSVNAEAMARDGHVFLISTNGVWLTESVPRVYLEIQTPPRP